ncbi:hypothetical protein EBB79_17610 [Parasedimentitalea marina]|uniref:Uncharacterized protein n=1 Tax=Parasedimentitalea marina TaxID=2483033 RepID=A0A3T0N629_9RHOB|nr:WVD2 family protein [Parasedimentitalea marina]AZV79506.1 hypothetical protein EBB79_17610 [Parasedimentitalea marina]
MTQSYQPDFDKLIQGQSHETSEAEIMAEVRKVMVAENVVHPEVAKSQPMSRLRRTFRSQPQEPHLTVPTEPQSPSATKTVARGGRGYQPRWSHNLLIFALAILIYSPMGVAAGVALTLAATVFLFWAVGSDRLATIGRACFGFYCRCLPAQADRVANWAGRVSDRLQALSDRLPSRLTQGLYIHSVATATVSDLDLVEPFDRLLVQRQGDRQTTVE